MSQALIHIAIALCLGQAALGRDTKVGLTAAVYGKTTDSVLEGANIAGTALAARLRHRFRPELSARLEAGFQAEAGNGTLFYTDDNLPRQRARLIEASGAWDPSETFGLRFGALPQDLLETPLILSAQTFPALVEELRFPLDETITLKFSAEQAVPVSPDLNDGPLPPPGNIPTLLAERITVEARPDPSLTLEARASHYAFGSPGTAAAAKSRFLGNTVRGMGAARSTFVNDYRVIEAAAGARWKAVSVGAAWLKNPSAPDGANGGYRVTATVKISVARGLRVSPLFELFRLESDVAPALFADRDRGRANRRGFVTGFDVEIGDDVSLEARMVRASTITPTPYQSELQSFGLLLRTRYDIL